MAVNSSTRGSLKLASIGPNKSEQEYAYGNTVITKYFSAPTLSELSCPFCHWSGDLTSAVQRSSLELITTHGPQRRSSEFCCPDCQTALAVVQEHAVRPS